ncbi:MAG: hypothetical protein ACP5H2_06335 [Solirubrobacteraceae bacterium]
MNVSLTALASTPSTNPLRMLRRHWRWLVAAIATVIVADVWVKATATTPTYDAFGWLVWGRQALNWNLNTNGAPSWKPLTFLFTLPYALAGASTQLRLWSLTAAASALGAALLAGRLAYRITGDQAPSWARWLSAAFGTVGILLIAGYSELVLIANSDPLVAMLCLAAIELHLSGRRGWAFAMLAGAGLGRPEGWAFIALYAGWLWLVEPRWRLTAVAVTVLVPFTWFVVPGLTSHSWLTAGDLALGSPNVIHGNKLIGVLQRTREQLPVPYQLAAAGALLYAAAKRQRSWLTLFGAAAMWVAVEVVFAYHGWSAVPRYLLEPATLLVVIGSAGIGRLAAFARSSAGLSRWGAVAVVIALAGGLAPTLHNRPRVAHGEIDDARRAAATLTNLRSIVSRHGAARIRSCGVPVVKLQYQSELAWVLHVNVGTVAWPPKKMVHSKLPIVLFQPHGEHWSIRAEHIRANTIHACGSLRQQN